MDPRLNQLDLLEMIKNLPLDRRANFDKCMKTEALYNSGLPLGLGFAAVSYFISKKYKLGTTGTIMTTFAGLSGYIVGKVTYSFHCVQKHLPEIAKIIEDAKLHRHRKAMEGSFVQPKELTQEFVDNLNEEQTWSNYDRHSNDDSNQFIDTSYNSYNEELATEKPINLKERITYDDLRRQSRAMLNEGRQSYRPMARERPKQNNEFMEDTTFVPENKEENVWS
ncbi:PREDICTED: uncharacterized protein LOC107193304 [Dufourea novaeangliae]|uniref:uncharacterized protein LOC107193304 n=1 Tax=Dufourea novaeangliae TaxID=178035 RepID=UPI0007677C7C|nr:PREDICTED: uncharacterized protein LOC107193304 [Dufourea novaeangliae]